MEALQRNSYKKTLHLYALSERVHRLGHVQRTLAGWTQGCAEHELFYTKHRNGEIESQNLARIHFLNRQFYHTFQSNSCGPIPEQLFSIIAPDQPLSEVLPNVSFQAGTSKLENPMSTPQVKESEVWTPKRTTAAHNKLKNKTAENTTGADLVEECMNFIEYFKFKQAANYDCHVCKKRLSCRHSLITHVTSLHGKKYLTKPLREQSKWIQRKIMSAIKTDSCLICDKKFSARQQVDMHFANQHNLQIVRCINPSCADVFLDKVELESHLIKSTGCYFAAKNNSVFAAKKQRLKHPNWHDMSWPIYTIRRLLFAVLSFFEYFEFVQSLFLYDLVPSPIAYFLLTSSMTAVIQLKLRFFV